MEIVKTAEGSTLTVALEGRLDTLTVPQLEKELKEIPEEVTVERDSIFVQPYDCSFTASPHKLLH